MPLDANLIESLLYETEGTTLDFKRDQYKFEVLAIVVEKETGSAALLDEECRKVGAMRVA